MGFTTLQTHVKVYEKVYFLEIRVDEKVYENMYSIV